MGLEEISSRLNRIFGLSQARAEPGKKRPAVTAWEPPVDISESDTAYLVKAEIPGVKKEDVRVTIEDGMLTLQGERKMEKQSNKFHRVERCYGSFMRSFLVPDDADGGNVNAEFKDGMLNITLAKTEKAKPRQIKVSVS